MFASEGKATTMRDKLSGKHCHVDGFVIVQCSWIIILQKKQP
jgi:hypothetical protein